MFEEIDFWRAGLNWIEWELDYDCPLGVQLPVLTERDRFTKFCRAYFVPNTRSPDWPRRWDLFDYLNGNVVIDGADNLPDILAQLWVDDDIFYQRQVSLASKLLTFRAPETYVPMDNWAKRGLASLDNLGIIIDQYICFNNRLNAQFDYFQNEYNNFIVGRVLPTNNEEGFMRRVLDCALMRHGGRRF